ncbi:MAG TPA: IclR family transcriptional regulator [Chloroflexota bacterium]|nr:IclR family transcriptional regulator [Chloroflexota bacterium]
MTEDGGVPASDSAPTASAAGAQSPYWVEALSRGLDVLRAFDADHPSLSLAELAQRLGWSRTTPYRFVWTLEHLGYLQRDPESRRYRLGPRVLELGFAYLHSLPLVDLARPYLARLHQETGASAHLGIPDGKDVLYVALVAARRISAITVHVGMRVPAHAGSIGKVLLAFSPPEVVDDLLASGPLPAYTERTVTQPARLRQYLARIREQGYVFNDQEFQLGVRSVAAPIFDGDGAVVAGINAAAPVHEFPDDVVETVVIPAVRRAAAQLSTCLGYRDSLRAAELSKR